MEGPPLGPGGEDITWPDQVAPWGRKASSTRKIKPQTSNLIRKGFVASAIFMLYTRKNNQIFSDIQNLILDFEVAALNMMNLEWSYIFPRS